MRIDHFVLDFRSEEHENVRASEQEQTGGAGVSEVSAKFQRIGWGPVPNDVHDLGTDLLVQARDRRRFDRGLIVGAQVKAGDSWFQDEERDADGNLLGWWYYEAGTAHFDDWVTHGLPHVLVLHDLDKSVSYWVHVTADRVVGTGKGCKILVPATQQIDEDHVDALLDVAAQQKAAPRLEGSSFNASSRTIAPGRRLRHALLAPRLVAPHRNTGYGTPVTSEEALALCAQARFLDAQRFSEHHARIPDPRQPYSGREWRWGLVRSFWSWAFDDDVDALARSLESAPDPESRAAAGVLLACAYLRLERFDDALATLDALVEKDELVPVDHAWALVQRARTRAEIGDVPGARADAVEVQRHLAADTDDVTVSALAAAAAWLLFATAGFAAGDLGTTLTAADTAVAWWRSQTVSWALGASERAFQSWSQDTTTRLFSEDTEALNLFAAELSADLTGEHGTWRGVASLSARQSLMYAHGAGDVAGISDAIDVLRRSGDYASLKLALMHLRRVGPAEALSHSLQRLSVESWTHTTAQSNLQMFAAVGELADERAADEWLELLVGVFSDPSAFVERVRPAFLVKLPVAEAIAGLLPAASANARLHVAKFLAGLNLPVDDVLVPPIVRWVDEFDAAELLGEESVRDGFRHLGSDDRGRLGARILGWLAENGDDEARRLVHQRALAGDLHALSAMGDVTVLTPDEAATLIEKFEAMCRDTVSRAENSTWGFGGTDAARGLVLFNIWFPEIAQWDPFVELLTHPAVGSEDKRGAIQLIIDLHERVPQSVKERITGAADVIGASPALTEVGGHSLNALATALGIVTGGVADDSANVAVAALALGSEQDRRDAATLLGRGWCERMRPLLASFIADSRSGVRTAAAAAIGRVATSAPDPVVVELARSVVTDRGVIVPAALLAGLSQGNSGTDLGREIARSLSEHPSARVRRLARDFLQRFG